MLKFKSVYDFYRLPEAERKKLIGKVFREEGRDNLYFPIGLSNADFNYGKAQGLIFVSPVMKHKDGKWFRVGATSPDDLDADLDFGASHISLRQEVIEYIKTMPKEGTTLSRLFKRHSGSF